MNLKKRISIEKKWIISKLVCVLVLLMLSMNISARMITIETTTDKYTIDDISNTIKVYNFLTKRTINEYSIIDYKSDNNGMYFKCVLNEKEYLLEIYTLLGKTHLAIYKSETISEKMKKTFRVDDKNILLKDGLNALVQNREYFFRKEEVPNECWSTFLTATGTLIDAFRNGKVMYVKNRMIASEEYLLGDYSNFKMKEKGSSFLGTRRHVWDQDAVNNLAMKYFIDTLISIPECAENDDVQWVNIENREVISIS